MCGLCGLHGAAAVPLSPTGVALAGYPGIVAKKLTIDRPAVEKQCGYAKALAQSIENHADNGIMGNRERAYHHTTANQLWEIVHGLTEAVNADDAATVRRWWKLAVAAAAVFIGPPAVSGAIEGATSAIASRALEDDAVIECATAMVTFGQSTKPVREVVQLSASATVRPAQLQAPQ